MKKRINLFQTKEQEFRTPDIILRLRKAGIIGASVCATILLIIGIVFFRLTSEKANLESEQQAQSALLQNNVDFQKEVSFFIERKEQLKKYLSEDAKFLPYYTLLNNILTTSGGLQIKLISFSLDNTQHTQIGIELSSYDAVQRFLQLTESDVFLQHFITIRVQPFRIMNSADGASEVYELKLDGQFRQIYETNP
jgi:hypothetical protein